MILFLNNEEPKILLELKYVVGGKSVLFFQPYPFPRLFSISLRAATSTEAQMGSLCSHVELCSDHPDR